MESPWSPGKAPGVDVNGAGATAKVERGLRTVGLLSALLRKPFSEPSLPIGPGAIRRIRTQDVTWSTLFMRAEGARVKLSPGIRRGRARQRALAFAGCPRSG